MSLDLEKYFVNHIKNSAIILCNETGIIDSKTYGFLFDESMSELRNYLQKCLPFETQCVGLFLDNMNYIYLPFLIVILNQLEHCFIVLNKKQIKKGTIQRLTINWIVSLSDSPVINFSQEKEISLQCCNNKRILIWKSKQYYCTFNIYRSIFCVVESSGTTGEPKTIRIPSACILPNAEDIKSIFNVNSEDCIYWGTPFSFDPFLIELLIVIISGASLIITPEETKVNPNKLFAALFTERLNFFKGISILQTVPSVFSRYSDKQVFEILNNNRLKVLAFGGEEFPKDVITLKKHPHLKLFNLYGITEVSCWASCYEVPQNSNNESIPLGTLLTEIMTEIRGEDNKIITNGQGELFIGSKSRFCLINSEKWEDFSGQIVFRSTGDLVRIDHHAIYYVTRKNNVIKRFGNRVNLSEIERIIYNETGLKNKCIFVRNKLLLFIILNENKLNEKKKILDKLQVKFLKILPEYCIPDYTDIIPKVPLNDHGKVNIQMLEQTYIDCNNYLFELSPIDLFQQLCCKYLGFNVHNIDDALICKNFFELGGNSVLSIQFLNEFSEIYEYAPEFVNLFFNESLKSCFDYIQTHLFSKKIVNAPENQQALPTNLALKKITIQWKYDLKACVDSPPFVHRYKNQTLISVGSFSNIIAILDETGQEFLKFTLSDAIESCVIASICGRYIFIGSIDGCMNCIDLERREISWKYLTNNKIKGTPCFIKNFTNLVFGNYDKTLYCITSLNGTLVWKTKLDGSISSSPLYDNVKELIFIGTMNGYIYCLSEIGEIQWSFQSGSPIFSSFAFVSSTRDSILCMNVTGNLSCLSTDKGIVKWQFHTNGNIFSSIRTFNDKCIFGSMDQSVYILEISTEKCKLIHKFMLDSAISTTPFIIDENTFVAATNAGSLYILDLEKKSIVSFYKFPAEVFSSPAIFENHVYVGCRDNNLYCLTISDETKFIPV